MSRIINNIRHQQEFIFKILLFLIAAVFIIFLLPKEGKFKYEFQKNKPWVHEDLFAPYDFAINKTNEEIEAEKNQLKNTYALYFNRDENAEQISLDQYKNWVDQNWSDTIAANGNKEDYIEKGNKYLKEIFEIGIIQLTDVLETKKDDFSVIVLSENNIAEDVELKDLLTIKQAYHFIEKEVENLSSVNDSFLLLGLENVLVHNIIFNEDLTKKDLENQLSSLSLTRGGVLKNEKIISTGEVISADKYQILQSLKQDYEFKLGSTNQFAWVLLGQILLVCILFYSIYIFIKNVAPDVFNDNMNIVFFLLLIIAFVSVTQLVLKIENVSIYSIPFCVIPLLIRTFFGNRLALFIYIISILLISFIVPNSFEFVFLESITGIITLFTVLNVNKRSELFYTSLIVFFTFSILYFGLSLLQEGSISKISFNKLSWFAIGAGFTLLTYPLIYLFEKVFGYISDVTLLELSDTNNDLLRELNLKAPGTFQHSLQVSNLAEEAIREIGGNPLLVRAGALYHDIGKMVAPAYFIENQSGVNPHDELGYEESASIIINHVINGIELAKKHKLPEQIIDFIRTHHGTTKTQYFLRMYLSENLDEDIDEVMFQYPGPIPYSKETAALMMADSVEAASRSLKVYNNETISNLVNGIIDYQVKENQFENTNITFRDISLIKKMFVKKLMNIYHVRIEYPK
ncbi:HD family phosphohydrolase [Vicingus serpentipes]|uniref:HD family phosphohydrolase n=1 Tax=Vicingus serpentipes TaxID=1926625 RepID=UPI001476D40B|nr:HDIG domain-containing metalloprotein [Vicingus serpentipes]